MSLDFDAAAEVRADCPLTGAWGRPSRLAVTLHPETARPLPPKEPDAQNSSDVNGEVRQVGTSEVARLSMLLRSGWAKRQGVEPELRRWLMWLEGDPRRRLPKDRADRLSGLYQRALEGDPLPAGTRGRAATTGALSARQRRAESIPDPKPAPLPPWLAKAGAPALLTEWRHVRPFLVALARFGVLGGCRG